MKDTTQLAAGAEYFREFVVRRSWLHGKDRLLSDQEYASLRARDGKFWGSLDSSQQIYLTGYVDGWRHAKR